MNDPILIAGAGPVGLTLALALKRRGVDVRIIDKSAARTDKSKALVMWPRTLELMEIEGCVQPFLDAGMKGLGAQIMSGRDPLAHVRLDQLPCRYPYALLIPQSETERVLEELLDGLDVRVERQVELLDFSAGDAADAAITARLRHGDGRVETIVTPYLVGCDGAHSTVRHGVGVDFEGSTMQSDFVLADAELDGDISATELTISWTRHGVLAIFPIIGNRFRIIVDLLDKGNAAAAGSTPTIEEVQALLDERGWSDLKVHDPIWLSRFHINERKVRDYRHGRVFLAGDAAHIHSPAGGQGMNTGMQDAFNLAWKMAMVCHGAAMPELLDSYSPERSEIGRQVLRNADTMTKVAITRNPVLREIRNVAAGTLGKLAVVRERMAQQLAELDLNYRDGPLTWRVDGARHPSPGERAPDLPVTTLTGEAATLHEALREGKFLVLSVGAARVDLPKEHAAIAMVATAQPGADYEAGHVYLIRPDAYVATSVTENRLDRLIAVLESLRAPQ
jgi:2-polyprenyl-6-methoxyphenol hydroxylase-like FAD-dependent oxidoreductase